MGFFSDLKDDLSQAVNEFLPEEEGMEGIKQETEYGKGEKAMMPDLFDTDPAQVPEKEEEPPKPAREPVHAEVVPHPMPEKKVTEEAAAVQHKRKVTDEIAILTETTLINGNIATEGGLEVRGSIVGNVESLGKLNITGTIQGNTQAAEIYAEGAKVSGDLKSQGSIKIGANTVIIGNIFANSAVIAGAIKGDIDVKGPVILDASAIVMGNIKSKSVQINNGAVIEGLCSQCYAEVNPTSFFDNLK